MADLFVDIFGAEDYDPCEALKLLRPIYMKLLAGQGPQKVEFRDRATWWHIGDISGLAAVIRQLESECRAKNGDTRPRRFAITAGSRRRYG
jgi:hypothetical protein